LRTGLIYLKATGCFSPDFSTGIYKEKIATPTKVNRHLGMEKVQEIIFKDKPEEIISMTKKERGAGSGNKSQFRHSSRILIGYRCRYFEKMRRWEGIKL